MGKRGPKGPTRSSFKPGKDNPGHRENRAKTGAGRQPGSGNKVTADIKLHLLNALNAVGGEEYLKTVAVRDIKSFTSLIRAIIPTKITTGPDPVDAAQSIRDKLKAIESATGGDDAD